MSMTFWRGDLHTCSPIPVPSLLKSLEYLGVIYVDRAAEGRAVGALGEVRQGFAMRLLAED